MPITTCGVHVPGPAVSPARYGLFTVAEPITPDDPHWEGVGVTWDDELCGDAHSVLLNCPEGDTAAKTADRDFNFCCAEPFTIYASYDCPPVGRRASEAFDIANRRLLALEEREVERVFWTGLTGEGEAVNPSLAEGNSDCAIVPVDLTPTVTGDALSPVAALAALESNLAECVPGVGVIHANYGVASYLANADLIYRDGNQWFTVTGHRVAFGSGYTGTGPSGDVPADGETWLFATGPVAVWRSGTFLTPPRLEEAVDRTINSTRVYAERIYSVGFSCCLFAVRMALTDCC